jgi:hypothetical protein
MIELREVTCNICGRKGKIQFTDEKLWTLVVCGGCDNAWDEFSAKHEELVKARNECRFGGYDK